MRALARLAGWGGGYLFVVLLERVVKAVEMPPGSDAGPMQAAA